MRPIDAESRKTLVNVNKGQDAYSVIGDYILNHVTAIEDMIAVIQINGVITKELYMVGMNDDGYFYWNSDWWEGEEDVALVDFFPVSDAERIKWIPCSERLPEEERQSYWVCTDTYYQCDCRWTNSNPIFTNMETEWHWNIFDVPQYSKVIAWMPLSEPYREGEK